MNTDEKKLPQFYFEDTTLVSSVEMERIKKKVLPYLRNLKKIAGSVRYTHHESSIILPADKKQIQKITKLASLFQSDELKLVIVIGIGGSNLGAKAVYDALAKTFFAQPKLVWLDTLSAPLLSQVVGYVEHEKLRAKNIVINLITKSGTTLESIANFETLVGALEARIGSLGKRIVVTTDEKSVLHNTAKKLGMHILVIPSNVGGRFSVFSAVGLFPLALAKIDITELCDGALTMRNACFDETSIAPCSAAFLYYWHENGIRVHDIFLFNPELESLGKWYRQLLAESIGKKDDKNGKEIRAGILPTVTIGSTDLHSMAQLYFGGSRIHITTFVYAKQLPTQIRVPRETTLGVIENVKGLSYKKLMGAVYEGVKKTYQLEKMPFMEVQLTAIDEWSIGACMQWKMMEVMLLGYLLNINAFDQPAVELYKKEVRNAFASIDRT